MTTSTVFTSNRTQTVRLPADTRFPKFVKKIDVRVVGQARILAPAHSTWDSFLLSEAAVTNDFMTERGSQTQAEREAF